MFINTYTARQNIYPIKKTGRYAHCFIYTISGTETYKFDGKTISTPPDTLLYIPKGANYITTLGGEESVVICIDFETVKGGFSEPFLSKSTQRGAIYSCFSEAYSKWEKVQGYKALCKSLFYKIISLTVSLESAYLDNDKVAKLSESVDYLHTHYLSCDFRIEKLYKIANISSRYYVTLFTKKFGMSPKDYLIFLKMERAKKLLDGEKSSIGDVAIELGYSDIYYFSRIFKQKVGCSPTSYQKRKKN